MDLSFSWYEMLFNNHVVRTFESYLYYDPWCEDVDIGPDYGHFPETIVNMPPRGTLILSGSTATDAKQLSSFIFSEERSPGPEARDPEYHAEQYSESFMLMFKSQATAYNCSPFQKRQGLKDQKSQQTEEMCVLQRKEQIPLKSTCHFPETIVKMPPGGTLILTGSTTTDAKQLSSFIFSKERPPDPEARYPEYHAEQYSESFMLMFKSQATAYHASPFYKRQGLKDQKGQIHSGAPECRNSRPITGPSYPSYQ